MFRKKIIAECGDFDVRLHGSEDTEFWTRASYVSLFGFINEPLAYYRVHAATHTDHSQYLLTKTYIIKKLSKFVDKKDRNFVLMTGSKSYLHLIGRSTRAYSIQRFKHLFKVLQLWPPSLFSKAFVCLTIGR
jgi:hypothetical protein